MASPSKVEAKSNAHVEAAPVAKTTTREQILAVVDQFLENPSNVAGWKALVALSQRQGIVTIEVDGEEKDVSVYEAVSTIFWSQYAQLPRFPSMKRGDVLANVVRNIGPRAPELQREIVITAIGKKPEAVSARLMEAIRAIPETEISAGMRDAELIDMAWAKYDEVRCAGEDAPEMCKELSKYDGGLALTLSVDATNYRSMVGEGVDQSPYAFGFVVDYAGHRSANSRPIYGGRLRLGSSIFAASARAGYRYSSNEWDSFNLFLDAGFFRISGQENHKGDIPIEPVGVTSNGRAYAMVPLEMERYVTGVSAGVGVEYERSIGLDLGVAIVLGLSGGLYAGAVSDDGCAYSYEPDAAGVMTNSGGAQVTVSDPSSLTNRCRTGDFTMGSALGATYFGLRKTWF